MMSILVSILVVTPGDLNEFADRNLCDISAIIKPDLRKQAEHAEEVRLHYSDGSVRLMKSRDGFLRSFTAEEWRQAEALNTARDTESYAPKGAIVGDFSGNCAPCETPLDCLANNYCKTRRLKIFTPWQPDAIIPIAHTRGRVVGPLSPKRDPLAHFPKLADGNPDLALWSEVCGECITPTNCVKNDYCQIARVKRSILMRGAQEQSPKPAKEEVNHPDHYGGKDNPYEVIKVLEAWLSREEFIGYCKGCIIKYQARADKKGGAVDYAKAAWYSDYLSEAVKRIKEVETK